MTVEACTCRLTVAACARSAEISGLPITWKGDVAQIKAARDVDLIAKDLLKINENFRALFGVRLGVVILDTVAATFDMEDEDKNSEVAKAIRKMRTLGAKFGGLVIPIHH